MLEAFKRYDGGETISSIMNWLNEQRLTNTRGQKMTFNSVGHMLHNRRYIGEFQYRDVIVPDGIPAIVPQDLFERVQEKLVKNKKAPARHKAEDDYLLTTKATAARISAARAVQAARGKCITITSACPSRRSAPSATRSRSRKNGSKIW